MATRSKKVTKKGAKAPVKKSISKKATPKKKIAKKKAAKKAPARKTVRGKAVAKKTISKKATPVKPVVKKKTVKKKAAKPSQASENVKAVDRNITGDGQQSGMIKTEDPIRAVDQKAFNKFTAKGDKRQHLQFSNKSKGGVKPTGKKPLWN